MAKMPDKITVELDPEVMELIRNLRNTVDLYVAHTENLIERVRVLEEGSDWEWIVQCYDCQVRATFTDQDLANAWCEEHATTRATTGSNLYHRPYITPKVKR